MTAVAVVFATWVAGGAGAVSLEATEHERHPRVAALDEIGRVGTGRDTVLILRGSTGTLRPARALRETRRVHRDLKRRLGFSRDKAGRPPIDVCLFASSRAYRAFVYAVTGTGDYAADRGIFVPYKRLVAADLSRGLAPLRHELVHALLRDEYGTLPDWLDEGLAALYVSVRPGKDKLVFLPGHRLADLRAARTAGRLPGPAALAASDDRDVYGPRHRAYYAVARHLLRYAEHEGTLRCLVHGLVTAPRNPEHQLEVLRRHVDWNAFLAWIEKR